MELLRGARGVLRVGHRGAAALAPESSLAAIEAAAACGADAVELDVLPRASWSRTARRCRRTRRGSTTRSRSRRASASPCSSTSRCAASRPAIVEALRRHGLLERSFVSSSSLAVLAAFAAAEPRAAARLHVSGGPARRDRQPRARARPCGRRSPCCGRSCPRRLPRLLRAAGASAATLNWAVVTPAAIEVCHRLGVAVYVWTVNEPALATTLVESGIDGIITDDPRHPSRGYRSEDVKRLTLLLLVLLAAGLFAATVLADASPPGDTTTTTTTTTDARGRSGRRHARGRRDRRARTRCGRAGGRRTRSTGR